MYIFFNDKERKTALNFWRRHRGLAPHDPATQTALGAKKKYNGHNRKPEVVVLLVPVYLDNNRLIEDIFVEWAKETYDLNMRQIRQASLDRVVEDDGLFMVENSQRIADLEETLEAFTDEELEALTSNEVN